MKKRILCIIAVILALFLVLTACGDNDTHTHEYAKWVTYTSPTCTDMGMQSRTCNTCGFVEYSQIPALGHKQVIDYAVAPTCTADGKTEGSHCSECNTVLVAQQTVKAEGHKYDNGSITTQATCINEGIKKFTCTVSGCNYSYNEKYSLHTYTSNELYNQSIKYVGEIVTYSQNGSELALGTGFIISSDGKILTNYHVLEDAYSATICINNKTYDIEYVLAYDSDIDLAVVKINAKNLPYATICKNPVSAGETVYAIGSSRGMTNTYTQGIITYANRIVDGVTYVQHDASITHGNSGGPLLNVYGEIIGINTWGISDSQNLNFAVFTAEIDNLVYGSPLTMAEFYGIECNVFEKIKNYVISSGTYDSSDREYELKTNTKYTSDYSSAYHYYIYYDVEDNELLFSLFIDADYLVTFFVTEEVTGAYYWSYVDNYSNIMSGTLYSNTYTNDSLLGYNYNNISSSSIRSSVRSLASNMMDLIILGINSDLSHLGVTASDLGFYYFD